MDFGLIAMLTGYGILMACFGWHLRNVKIGQAILEAIDRTDPELDNCLVRLEVIDEISYALGMRENR